MGRAITYEALRFRRCHFRQPEGAQSIPYGFRVAGDLLLPMTGRPARTLPAGWDQIPGARGCTPQSCSFRDHYRELQALKAQVFGLSTQTTEYQREAAERLHLPFELLNDSSFAFAQALRLPMFEVEGIRLIKRVTLIAKDGTIVKHFYPVFPPDKNINDVLAWVRSDELQRIHQNSSP
jgi:peroxiredoxin